MIAAAGILLLSKEGRVLLLRRSEVGDAEGLWALPGGKIEDGESAESAAARETFEETSYRVGHAGMLLMRRVRDEVDYTTFLKTIDDEFVPKLNEEHTSFAWVLPEEALFNIPLPAPTAIYH
jgi:uncharacterized protein